MAEIPASSRATVSLLDEVIGGLGHDYSHAITIQVEAYKRAVKGTRDAQYVFQRPEVEKARELLKYFEQAGRAIDDHAEAAADAKRLRREEHI